MQCTAKSKRTGKQCRRDAMHGAKVCYNHGGKTPRGIGSPHTKTGRYSKDLPTRMAAQYRESLEDTDLLNLTDEIALIDARLNDILKRVDTGESGKLWGGLADLFADLEVARLADDKLKIAYCVNEAAKLVKRGLGDYAAWGEVGNLIEQRRRLVDSRAKHLRDMQLVFTAEQGMLLIGRIVDILQSEIEDKQTLDRIGRAITAIIDRPHVIDAG